ncbi:metallophosphoesterase [Alteromonas sp. A081]|uniref:metallophosphoesterase n=1 Tax=Alteromonas sp. A081 TaxID=3410269 RepID=UPI003B97F780
MKTVIQFSDCHLLHDTSRKGYGGISPYHSLERLLTQLVQSGNTEKVSPDVADAVLITGDISGDDSPASYTHFLNLMELYVDVPWYVIPGNHDANPHYDEYLVPHMLLADLPLRIGSWCIHGLDTRPKQMAKGAQGEIDSHELDCIERAVRAADQQHHLLALHHHILPSNSWMDKHNLVNAEHLIEWLDSVKEIKHIIHGHVHSPLRQQVGKDNITSFGCPSSCWQWEMQTDFAVSEEKPGYHHISLHDDGDVAVSIKRLI